MIKKFAVLLVCFSLGVIAVPGCGDKSADKPAEAEPAATGDETPAAGDETPSTETPAPSEGSGE